MSSFRYVEPPSLDDVIGLISDPVEEVHLLAGGTALVPMLKSGLIRPAMLVGMRQLEGLRSIRQRDGALVIGSLVTHAEIAASPLVRDGWPLLAAACGAVATVRIRNQATIGGNIVHADPNQDPPPALLVLDAVARVVGPLGERSIPVRDLFVDVFQTSLDEAEVLVELSIASGSPDCKVAYQKVLPRSRDDYATVSVAGLIRMGSDDRISEARLALGGVGPTPIRLAALEAALVGMIPAQDSIADAVALIGDVLDPIEDARGSAGYKRRVARVWTERTIGALTGVAVA